MHRGFPQVLHRISPGAVTVRWIIFSVLIASAAGLRAQNAAPLPRATRGEAIRALALLEVPGPARWRQWSQALPWQALELRDGVPESLRLYLGRLRAHLEALSGQADPALAEIITLAFDPRCTRWEFLLSWDPEPIEGASAWDHLRLSIAMRGSDPGWRAACSRLLAGRDLKELALAPGSRPATLLCKLTPGCLAVGPGEAEVRALLGGDALPLKRGSARGEGADLRLAAAPLELRNWVVHSLFGSSPAPAARAFPFLLWVKRPLASGAEDQLCWWPHSPGASQAIPEVVLDRASSAEWAAALEAAPPGLVEVFLCARDGDSPKPWGEDLLGVMERLGGWLGLERPSLPALRPLLALSRGRIGMVLDGVDLIARAGPRILVVLRPHPAGGNLAHCLAGLGFASSGNGSERIWHRADAAGALWLRPVPGGYLLAGGSRSAVLRHSPSRGGRHGGRAQVLGRGYPAGTVAVAHFETATLYALAFLRLALWGRGRDSAPWWRWLLTRLPAPAALAPIQAPATWVIARDRGGAILRGRGPFGDPLLTSLQVPLAHLGLLACDRLLCGVLEEEYARRTCRALRAAALACRSAWRRGWRPGFDATSEELLAVLPALGWSSPMDPSNPAPDGPARPGESFALSSRERFDDAWLENAGVKGVLPSACPLVLFEGEAWFAGGLGRHLAFFSGDTLRIARITVALPD